MHPALKTVTQGSRKDSNYNKFLVKYSFTNTNYNNIRSTTKAHIGVCKGAYDMCVSKLEIQCDI